MPQSPEANRIKKEAAEAIAKIEDSHNFMTKAELFYAHKAYNEALVELNKAELLGINSDKIKELKGRILRDQADALDKISGLIKLLNTAIDDKDFTNALMTCKQLIDLDYTNSRKWTAKLDSINSLKQHEEEKAKQWNEMMESIDMADNKEDWAKVVDLCKEALKIKNNPGVQLKLEKAQLRLQLAISQKAFDEAINNEDWKLVLDISKKYPELKKINTNNKWISIARNKIRSIKNPKAIPDDSQPDRFRHRRDSPIIAKKKPDIHQTHCWSHPSVT